MPHFDALKIYSCGKHCEKRRNCLQQAISPFLTMFSILYGTYFKCSLKCLQFFFNLDQSRVLSSVNGLSSLKSDFDLHHPNITTSLLIIQDFYKKKSFNTVKK